MRYLFIDNLRGIAFIFMIIHHIFYFKDASNGYTTSYANNIFIDSSGTIARTLFILLVGLSLSITKDNNKNKDNNNKDKDNNNKDKDNKDKDNKNKDNKNKDNNNNNKNKDNFKKKIKRSGEILLHAALISLVTYIYFPTHFIRFGVLHFISLASLLGSFFVDKKILTFIFMIIFIILKPVSVNNPIIDTITGARINYNMMDYFPFFKWFKLVLLGLFIGQNIDLLKIKYLLEKNEITNKIFNKNNLLTKIGTNCLQLYTFHVILLIFIYNKK